MKRRGFTLIELLAVIVILAIIALIATPLVLNTINDARKGAASASATTYVKEIEKEMITTLLNNNAIEAGEHLVSELSIKVKGDKPKEGAVCVSQDGTVEKASLKINGYVISYDGKTSTTTDLKEIETLDCSVKRYKETILNGADPVVSGDLVAVTISSDGIVTKANKTEEWYNYENKNWANAVVLFGEDTYNVGDVILEGSIKQYYVWIPRYKYQLWNVNSEALYPSGATSESAINIEFESKDTAPIKGTENGDWLTHPAFTSFDTNGIWVGKYETSYNEPTYMDNTTFLTSNPNYSAATKGSEIVIKPNVRSLTNKNVSTLYTMSRNVNSELNSHMMKNSEWGAVAYLTYSNYGKCTNGTCEEIYINNVSTGYTEEITKFSGQWQYSGTVTGCSGDSASAGVNSNNNTCEPGYAWNESNNKASTTGNTSGIYDMSGGNWEYMMGVVKDSNGKPVSGRNSKYNSGFNGTFGCPTCDSVTSGLTELTNGIDFPTDTRYYDLYDYNYNLGTDIWYDYANGQLGDATKEIAVTKPDDSIGNRGLYYIAYAGFPSIDSSWFIRGGNYNYGTSADIFTFSRFYGHRHRGYTVRIILAY